MDKKILKFIAKIIFDKRGKNLLILDIKKISTSTDFLIIAEGNVPKHVQIISDYIKEKLKKEKNILPYKEEGRLYGDWIVLDYMDFIIHIFTSKLREKYLLEELWSKGKKIDLENELKKEEVCKKKELL